MYFQEPADASVSLPFPRTSTACNLHDSSDPSHQNISPKLKQTKMPHYFLTDLTAHQEICYKIDFPRGLLVRWFIALYVNDIVEEEVTILSL